MKMMYRHYIVAGVVSVVLVATLGYAGVQTEKVFARFTNKLGVESQVEVASVKYGKTLPERLCPDNYFLVQVGNGCHLAIPPSAFKGAHWENTRHNITLFNGTRLSGTLMGELIERVDPGQGKEPRKYALQSITVLTLQVSKTAQSQSTTPKKPQDRWQLVHPNAELTSYLLLDPHFGFTYPYVFQWDRPVGAIRYVKEYIKGTKVGRSPSFVIDVAGEKIPATISDFVEVSMKPGKQTKITLMSASGVKTPGQLILKSQDNHVASDWALMAEIEGGDGTLLILSSPQCTIKKTTERIRIEATRYPGAPHPERWTAIEMLVCQRRRRC